MNNLKELTNTYLSVIFKIGLVITVVSTLFLFTNLTTEFYETTKFLILFAFSILILILLTLRFTLTGTVAFIRTPLDIPLLLLLSVAVVSTVISPAPYVSLLGNQLKINGSLVSLIVYVFFYFILINNLKSAKEAKWILNIAAAGAGILSLIALTAFAGYPLLPPPFTHGVNFTPAGSTFSTTAILALLIPILISNILHSGNLLIKSLNSFVLLLAVVTIILTGTWPVWLAGAYALILSLIIFKPVTSFSNLNLNTIVFLIIPLILALTIGGLSFIPPVGGAYNPLYEKSRNFPREVQLPFVSSWKISVSAFRDSPFWGTGPSTYMFNFTNYKPVDYNQSRFWNVRFDSAFNEYLEILSNLGAVGLIALLSLTALFISAAYKTLVGGKDEFQKGLAIAGLTFFVILALHVSSLVVWVIGLLILACFMVCNTTGSEKRWGESGNFTKTLFKIAGNLSSTDSSKETIRIDALPGILLVVSIAIALVGSYFAGKFTMADYHHRQALNAISKNQGIAAYNELVEAEKLNPYNDLYRTDLAQTNFAIANAIAASKGPTEASPAGSLTADDAQNIQILLQQSINESRNAVALSPRSAVNWEILALLYRQISGVAQNALVFSLDAYGRAILQDPLNPLLRLSVGGTYYAVRNYDLAIRFFTDSINLKPDFANGYYNLSVALRDKGDLNAAVASAERILQFVDASSADYKTASDYLADLKSKVDSGVKDNTPLQPPAAETSGALKDEELPNVVNVGNPPEKIATPSAIKAPGSTPEPSPTP